MPPRNAAIDVLLNELNQGGVPPAQGPPAEGRHADIDALLEEVGHGEGIIGAVENLGRIRYAEKIPFAGGAIRAERLQGVKDALRDIQAWNEGRLEDVTIETSWREKGREFGHQFLPGLFPDEPKWRMPAIVRAGQAMEMVVEYLNEIEEARRRGKTIPAEILEGIIDMVPYAIEFMVTGGAATAATKTTVGRVGLAAMRKYGTTAARRALIKAGTRGAGWVSTAAVRTMLMPQRMLEGKIEREIEGQTPAQALWNALTDTFIENLSEVTGERMGKGAVRAAKAIPGIGKLAGKVDDSLRRVWAKVGKPPAEFDKLLARLGYDGIIGEIGEERLGDVLRGAIGQDDMKLIDALPTPLGGKLTMRQLVVEAGIFAVPMGAGVAARRLARAKSASAKDVADALGMTTPEMRIQHPELRTKEQREHTVRAAQEAEDAQVAAREVEAPGAEEEGARPGRLRVRDDALDREAAAREAAAAEAGAEVAAQAPPAAVIGRPELANPAIPEQVRALVDQVDERRKQQGIPHTRADVEVTAEAEVRLATNAAAERANIKAKGDAGQALDDTETFIAKHIISEEGLPAVLSGDVPAIAELSAFIDAYRATGTEQARAFRQRRDPVMGPADRIKKALTEAILQRPEGVAPEQWAEQVAGLVRKLKALGHDLNELDFGDPVKAAEALGALRTLRPAKGGVAEHMYEYWRNAILSAPTTQAANIIGNTAHTAWHYLAERPTEALVNTIARREGGAEAGEFVYLLKGLLPGLSRGASNFLKSFRTELPWLEVELSQPGRGKVEESGIVIPGKLGRVIRLPQRLLQAADQFAKTMIVEMEIGAQGYRIAKAEGLEGDALSQRIADLRRDIHSEAWDRSLDKAYELTFQQRTKATKAIIGLRHAVPGLRYVIPFVTTPMGIFRLGVRKSPVGALNLVFRTLPKAYAAQRRATMTGRAGDIKAARLAWSRVTQQIAEQILAWSVMLWLYGSRDPDDPWITGAAKARRAGERELAYRTAPPQSIRLGGKWYSYARIEPFATTLSSLVDIIDSIQRGEGTAKMMASAFDSVVGQMKNKTFLSGIGDIVRALEAQQPSDKLAQWLSRFSVSWVPNIVRSAARARRSFIPERRVWGKGPEANARLLRRIVQGTELGFEPDYPRCDLWGRPIQAPGAAVGSDFLWRLMIPVRVYDREVFVGDRILLNWNNQHPDDAWYPQAPSRTMSDGRGKRRAMTDEEYNTYARRAGELARRVIESQDWKTPDKPKPWMKKAMERVISRARRVARAEIRARWATVLPSSGETR